MMVWYVWNTHQLLGGSGGTRLAEKQPTSWWAIKSTGGGWSTQFHVPGLRWVPRVLGPVGTQSVSPLLSKWVKKVWKPQLFQCELHSEILDATFSVTDHEDPGSH